MDTVDACTQWMQWTQYAVDAVCSGHSRIVVYGGGDIVFCGKRSNQRLQWMQYAVDKWYMVVGYCSLVQKGQTSGCSGCSHTVDTVHSGRSMQWMQYEVDAVDIVFDAKTSNQWIQ